MKVNFTQSFGAFVKGTDHDLPDQVAKNLIRVGVATEPQNKPAPVSTTEVYKSKTRTVRKDM